ncbi:Universal stress family protein [Desulfosarcina cetonica]|uniref:universal stress protein n=1 Tax=Desulfosarcina cetonica TaxID=90730 RepID=UPI0006D19FD4|nr:universal stress protein [Desulfosarcina cetonica]VTR64872.1 Universal stress family protein [Desulfosarcina cetonica]
MSTTPKRLLLAVDGSPRSMQTVRYAASENAFDGMQLVLFHVFNSIPDTYYDLEREPKSVKIVSQVRGWEAQQRKAITAYMAEAKKILLDAGHAEAAVETRIVNRKKGAARDIIAEAQKGYHAVLACRRGATALETILIGSVTQKLLEKISIPILIAGQTPANGKLLLAVDGSEGAKRAVQFVADTRGPRQDDRFLLVHVLRNVPTFDIEAFFEEELVDNQSVFDGARDILVRGGCKPEHLATRTITGVASRAGAIIETAAAEGCGTIVVGRRGLSRMAEFFMGRVGNKVVQASDAQTVWVVP